ncbi:hypothetical protein [Paenibacillus sp. BAC0078]
MKNFKMAYVILCHKNPEQINLLLNVLTDEHAEFFLHVDQKSGIEEQIIHRGAAAEAQSEEPAGQSV